MEAAFVYDHNRDQEDGPLKSAANMTLNNRQLKLVLGYLPASDFENSRAAQLGLSKRFAWVLETYRPELGPDSHFDAELFRFLAEHYLSSLSIDRLQVTMPGQKGKSLESLDCVREEPFQTAVAYKGGDLVCFMETTPWERVGGPQPYHDSHTLSVYVRDYSREAVEKFTKDVAQHLVAEVSGVFTGEENAPRLSMFQRLINRFG